MIPAGVKYFWEDIVCKYWKWARKAVGLEGSDMKPALSIMHGKAHMDMSGNKVRFVEIN